MVKPLHDCDFRAERVVDGYGEFKGFTGVCAEWPDLKTRTHKYALDAVDDIISQVKEKLRHVHASENDAKAAARAAHG